MALLEQATEHLINGRFDEAESLCRTVLETEPEQVGVYYLLALIANAKQDYDAAIFLSDLAIQLGVAVAEVHVERGRALLALGRNQDAVVSLQTAIDLTPEVPDGARLLVLAQTAPAS